MHARIRRCGLVLLAFVLGAAPAADAKSYSADRFDSRVEVMSGGALRVVETVVFRFEGGPFTEVFRQLRTRQTDGVEFVGAAMDGVPFPEGEGPGTVRVKRGSRVDVTWRFAATSDSVHTYELTYVMRGVVADGGSADVLTWTALPHEHKYRIGSSTIDVALPASPLESPAVDFRRVNGETSVDLNDGRLQVTATNLRSNGRVGLVVRMPPGSVIDSPPAWQQQDIYQRRLAPRWFAAAGFVLVAGFAVLFAIRQRYDAPPPDATVTAMGSGLPDALSPAEAGALTANGSASIEHAMATLFALAERGEITIREDDARSWGQRRFIITHRPARRPVAPYEQAVLDLVFTNKGQTENAVSLDKARSRLTWHFSQFSRPLQGALKAEGLIDADRQAVKRTFGVVAVVFFLVGACVLVPLGLMTLDTYGGWPMVVPLAMAVVGFIALICQFAHTPLSNEGLRRARHWRGFQSHLKEIARDRAVAPSDGMDRLLPYAVALGVAVAWSKFLKKHRIPVPAWFQPAAAGEGATAFIAFVATGGAATGGAGGSGVSGAGGGASGAG